jgi:hypothetical protein
MPEDVLQIEKPWLHYAWVFTQNIINLLVLSPLISCDQCKRNDEDRKYSMLQFSKDMKIFEA